MKGIVRGVLGLALAVGMNACTNDATVDLGGEFDTVDVDKNSLYVGVGDSSAVLVRLVDDLRASTPASFTVSNVGAGVRVTYDETYRPDYTQGDTLIPPRDKPQQRYWVVGTGAGLNEVTFSAGGASTTIRAYVTPKNLGAALSQTTGVVAGDEITITAPAGLRFDSTSVVSFTSGPAVVVTNRAADGSSITFLVGPGVSGTASVTKVSYTFAPAAPPVTLRTTTSLDVPGITTIPIVVNPSSPAAGAVATVTAANFKFLPTFSLTVGGVPAYVVSRSADSSSAQIVLPVGTGPVVVNGVALSFLTSVTLNGLTPVATVNAPTTRPYNGADPDASAATITAAAPGTEVVFYDTFTNGGPDLIGDGGPNRFYNLVVPSAGSRTIKVTWNTAADLDLFLIDAGFTSILASSAGTGNPETFTYNFPAAGSYLIGVVNYQSGPTPVFQISIK